ncbi:MAG: ABC transporter permease [Ktedonobacterales bacterium]
MSQLAALLGAMRYEFLMQIRRIALWVGMLFLYPFCFNHFNDLFLDSNFFPSARYSLGQWAQFIALFFPLAAGLLLADRFTRDRKTRVDELLTTTHSTISARLAGKYLGSALATLVPPFVAYAIGAALIITHWRAFGDVPLALGLFLVGLVPAVLFVGAFSIACTTALWPVLYQFLFVGYWFWGNFLNPKLGIPTLNGTLLTPSGKHAITGLFFSASGWHYGQFGRYSLPVSTFQQGIESLLLLLGCALVALVAAWGWLRWQQAHR